ncbi:hypothetical protein FANTH_8254 [Fusarium anthophilum]|uniref:Heterokaryon incompatibility domain-containing protein n=1 Tax=Fusarium anthophilum TaxID=48485 RepID=A0A8H5E145_9HYPO|nr:hypothetical protein FANTH_8254 [Fusarium anthophilum]
MLQECRNHHNRCQRTSRAPPPFRLIDVSPKINDSVQVRDTKSIKNPSWAALSYCWGEEKQSGITTEGNIEARQIQLAICELPPTIRDAIHVCRQLNIQYLWVDSICILQDNATDKFEEIAKMTGVYQDAIFTISASCALSADRGFLEVRTPYPPGVALPVRTSKGYVVAQLIEKRYRLRPEPIDARAWTFQERILSTRFLSFATDGVEWKCSQSQCNLDKQGRYSKPEFSNLSPDICRISRWKALIAGYSGRYLSYLKDRPVAFAGVAQAYCQANSLEPGHYLAGFWRQTLLEDLLWLVNPLTDFFHGLDMDPRLVVGNSTGDTYIAPSWSWVSALYTVRWLPNNLVETAEVISTKIELVQPDVHFGAVRSGILRLRGPLHHDQLSIDWEGEIIREYKHQSDSHTHKREIHTSVFSDLEGEYAWFFEIGVLQEIGYDQRYFIPQEDCFQAEDPFWEEGLFEEEHPRHHKSLHGDIAGLVLLSTGKEKEFIRVGVYKEELGGTFHDDLSDGSCKLCALNKERELTEIEIV